MDTSTAVTTDGILLLHGEREQLEAEHLRGAPGRRTAEAHADIFDAALRAMLSPNRDRPGWALVAVGGYGRRELSPRSDVDLMVLYHRRDRFVDELARAVFYSLWDEGLDAAHSVRSVADCRRLAAGSLAAQTSFLTSRLVAGDATLFDALRERISDDVRSPSGRAVFLRSLLADNRRRHQDYDKPAYRLEPHLKEGLGGLRDLHSVLWAAMVAHGVSSLDDLVGLGVLDAEEWIALQRAVDFLLRVRHHLHYLTGRRTDQLFFAHQNEMARFIGYADTRAPVAALMRDLYRHADAVLQSTRGFWEEIEPLLLERQERQRIADQVMSDHELATILPGGTDDASVAILPEDALRLFATAARRGLRLSHRLCRRLRAGLASATPVPTWSSQAQVDFLAVLRSGPITVELLEAMDRVGLLGIYVPEWSALRFLTQADIRHVNTADRHSYLAVAELHRLAAGEGDDNLALALFGDIEDLDALLLAALFHDIGKGTGEPHDEVGAAQVQAIGERMGLARETIGNLVFLVRHHLLLPRTATRRDLDDEGIIQQLAETIGSVDRLRMLYVLTLADSLATGPSAWSDWKAILLRDVYFKVLGALQRDHHVVRDTELRLAARCAAVEAALVPSQPRQAIAAFIARMPSDYLMSQPVDAIVRHFGLLTGSAAGPVRVQSIHVQEGNYDEFVVAAEDHPGLLWRICGVFTLHGVSILEARVYTDAGGTALDVFRLSDAFEPSIPSDKRAKIERDLVLAVEGRLALGYRIAEKLSHYRRIPRPAPGPQPRVVVDNAGSSNYSIVEVFAPDRLGLLYTITRALSDMNLDVHLAKVTTLGREAIDVFYVRDLRGQKIVDPTHLREMEKTILFELER